MKQKRKIFGKVYFNVRETTIYTSTLIVNLYIYIERENDIHNIKVNSIIIRRFYLLVIVTGGVFLITVCFLIIFLLFSSFLTSMMISFRKANHAFNVGGGKPLNTFL